MFATTLLTKSKSLPSPSPGANSPGPSGLSYEIGAGASTGTSDIEVGGSDMSRDPTREGTPDVYGAGTGSSRKRDEDSAALRRLRANVPVSTPLPDLDLSGPFAIYVPPGGNSSEEEDGVKLQRRKGKGRVKEVEKDQVGEEEGDDRLYCVCQELYDPEVRFSF